MAARVGMLDLIQRTRLVINDTGFPPVLTDLEIQAALDARRHVVSAASLSPDDVLSGQPTVFRAPYGFWETDAATTSSAGAALDPDGVGTSAIDGVWTFATTPGVTVYLTGNVYDLWGSAASLLEQLAARYALEFDFATDQQRFDRSQKTGNLLKIAREYARRAVPPGTRSWGTWRSW